MCVRASTYYICNSLRVHVESSYSPRPRVSLWFALKLWASLYVMVWLGLLEFILVWAPISGFTLPLYGHVVLGIVIFAIAYSNASKLGKTQCPARIRRIAKATVGLAVFEGVLGILLYLGNTGSLPHFITDAVSFLHLGTALAIVTQAASTATAYDMWEEKEFV